MSTWFIALTFFIIGVCIGIHIMYRINEYRERHKDDY